jgi:NDP-sugar pyrophosphorylase family protein
MASDSFPVVILAGGLGTRLGALTKQQPKALVPVLGRPFIFHQLELLRRNKINRVILSIGFLAEKIQQALKDFPQDGFKIEYVLDGNAPLGTGGAVRKAAELVDGPFFILYGDAYLDIDYGAVESAYKKSRKSGLMVVYRNQSAIEKSNVIFGGDLIERYDKKEFVPEMEYIDYGLSAIDKDAVKSFPLNKNFDLGDIYSKLIGSSQMAGLEVTQRFYEVGSVAGIKDFEKYLAEK